MYFNSRHIVLIYYLFVPFTAATAQIPLSPLEIERIGIKVFENECAGKEECLLDWNEGERFLSLGIGHFIWYPEGVKEPFEESFPLLIRFLKAKGVNIPVWLDKKPIPNCPWASREDFLKNIDSSKARELRTLLIETKLQQSVFLVSRLDSILLLMLDNTDDASDSKIKKQFKRMESTGAGIFALVDYANFKGLGISLSERYQGKGWGLIQILSRMKGNENGSEAVEEFVQIADQVLTERVDNSPLERQEQRWLLGWKNRVRSYLKT